MGLNGGNELVVVDKAPDSVIYADEDLEFFKEDERVKTYWLSAGDALTLKPEFEGDKNIDAVVYTAALADVPYVEKNPMDGIQVNVNNPAAFVNFLGSIGYKGRFIFLSSESVYGKHPDDEIPFKETTWTDPENIYGASKLAGEVMVRALCKKYGIPYVIIRSATMFGPKAREKQVIPVFAKQVLTGKPVTLMGTGKTTSRDFIFVEDTVNAALVAVYGVKTLENNIYNIGTGKETYLLNLVNGIKTICNMNSDPGKPGYVPIKHIPQRGGEEGLRVVLDTTNAKERMKIKESDAYGWEPEVEFREGLQQTLYWVGKEVCEFDEKELELMAITFWPEKYAKTGKLAEYKGRGFETNENKSVDWKG